VVHNFGGPDALNVVELPTPDPGPGQLRIKVAAAAINPVDLATRAGHLGQAIPETGCPSASAGTSRARSTPSAPESTDSPSATR